MSTVIEFKGSKTLALDTVMDALTDATGLHEKPGAGGAAFRYYLPPAVNCFGVWLGGGGRVENTHGTSTQAESLLQDCRIKGRFIRAKDAEAFEMAVLGALPLYHDENVEWLRLEAQPVIDHVSERLANDKDETILFECDIYCICVFRTLLKYDQGE